MFRIETDRHTDWQAVGQQVGNRWGKPDWTRYPERGTLAAKPTGPNPPARAYR